MKEKIKELIKHHQNSKNECYALLEELSQIDTSKLDYLEEDALKESKIRYEVEYEMRSLFLNDLQDLL